MNNPEKTGIVTLENLREDKRVYVILKNLYLQKILIDLRKFGDNIKDISKNSKIKYSLLKSLFNNQQKAIKLKDIYKICTFLKKNKLDYLLQLNKNILELRGQNGHGIKKPKLSINFNNKEGARVISSLYGDGGIEKNYNRVLYSNKSKELRNSLLKNINKIIGKTYYSSQEDRGCTNFTFPPILGFIYEKIGYKPGNKLEIQQVVPEFIYKFPQNLIVEFLSQLIDDEGYVYCKTQKIKHRNKIQSRNFFGIRLTFSNKPNSDKISPFFKSLLKLLHKIEVFPSYKLTKKYRTKKDYKREKWTINISGRGLNNLKNLNLIIPYKRKNLNKIFNLKKETHMSKYEAKILILNTMLKLQQNKKEINTINISNKLSLSQARAREILSKFNKKEYLIKRQGARIFNNKKLMGQYPNTYQLTNKGLNLLNEMRI